MVSKTNTAVWREITPTSQRGCETGLTEIRLKKGESVDKALRRLKKKIDREGTLKEVRNHRHFEKPSERRRRKMKAARFSAMLSARYADLLVAGQPELAKFRFRADGRWIAGTHMRSTMSGFAGAGP